MSPRVTGHVSPGLFDDCPVVARRPDDLGCFSTWMPELREPRSRIAHSPPFEVIEEPAVCRFGGEVELLHLSPARARNTCCALCQSPPERRFSGMLSAAVPVMCHRRVVGTSSTGWSLGVLGHCRGCCQLRAMDSAAIQVLEVSPDRTWLWSDLHLSDRAVVFTGRRLFDGDVVRMNAHLLREWRRVVRPQDTIVCLGDVAHPDAWADRRLVLDVAALPGRRVLVVGNHDLSQLEDLRDVGGFVEQHLAVLCATDPPLALTHMPLRRVPPGAVNVHGHVHGGRSAPPATSRHLNVAVDRTDYAPVSLAEVLELAAALMLSGSVYMREIRSDVTLENWVDRAMFDRGHGQEVDIRRSTVHGLVARGAVLLILPQNVVERLGLEHQQGTAFLPHAGRAAAGRPCDRPDRRPLGRVVLAMLDLIADSENGTLTPRRPGYRLLPLRSSGGCPQALGVGVAGPHLGRPGSIGGGRTAGRGGGCGLRLRTLALSWQGPPWRASPPLVDGRTTPRGWGFGAWVLPWRSPGRSCRAYGDELARITVLESQNRRPVSPAPVGYSGGPGCHKVRRAPPAGPEGSAAVEGGMGPPLDLLQPDEHPGLVRRDARAGQRLERPRERRQVGGPRELQRHRYAQGLAELVAHQHGNRLGRAD